MADHDREQAHIMSASTAFANVQARNTEIRRSYTLFMEVYEPTLNRIKKSTHKPDAYSQRTMRIREVSPLVEGSLEERPADYNRSAHTSYERAER
jgi:vacuolar-type H+-ATPase subunit E/Vma4